MNILVIAEHDGAALKLATLNVIRAASACGADVHVMVAGADCAAVAEQTSKVAGVAKVLLADGEALRESLPETSPCR